jgi:putative tricarboxylic transport membrane protein
MMDYFAPVLDGFVTVLEPENLLFCLIGALLGMVVGVLPGLGPVATMSVLLPLTYGIEPVAAVIMLAGIYYGTQYGGTITSVLLRLPGEATSVVTVLDGYQMARQGRAGSALGIAAIGSFIGGTVAVLGLTFLAPIVASIALRFGPPEFAALALAGILMVAGLSSGSPVRGLVAAGLGLWLATVGMDPFSGKERFAGGNLELSDGIDFVTVAMGLFGLGEIFHMIEQRAAGSAMAVKVSNVRVTALDWSQSKWAIVRGTILGFVIGLIPGGGATLSSLLSYSTEKKLAKDPSRFGRGAIEGVAGPETANNAGATAAFIPLLTLGLPANAVLAVLYGALLIQGVTPGPKMIEEHPEMFWGVVNSMWVGNLFLLLLALPLVGVFVRLLRLRSSILAPLAVAVAMLGVYSLGNSFFDMWIVLAFGVVGWLMRKYGFEPGPLVLAFVLGSMLEDAVLRSLLIFDGDATQFVLRPISGSIIIVTIAVIILTNIFKRVQVRNAARIPTKEKA